MNEIQDVLIPNPEVESQRILNGAGGYQPRLIDEKAIGYLLHKFYSEFILLRQDPEM